MSIRGRSWVPRTALARFSAARSDVVDLTLVKPIVVEVSADVGCDGQSFLHLLRFVRPRLTRHWRGLATRYDTLAQVKSYLPGGVSVESVHGVRVLTPSSHVHRRPGLSRAFAAAETRAMSAPLLRRLGGFMVVVAKKS